jgi:hypothetical protein
MGLLYLLPVRVKRLAFSRTRRG